MLFHQWQTQSLYRNWSPEYQCKDDPYTFELGAGARFLYFESPYAVFGVRNTIVVISTIPAPSSHAVVRWNSADTHLQITSVLPVYLEAERSVALDGGIVRLICARTQMNHTYLLEDSRLLLDGVVCSFWLQPSTVIQPWSRIHSGSKLWASLLSNQMNSEVLFASKILSSNHSIYHIDKTTHVGLVAGMFTKQSPDRGSATERYFVDQYRPWISRFAFSAKPEFPLEDPVFQNHRPNWLRLDPFPTASHGWLSNSESNLWFGGHVHYLRVTAINKKYFYIIFTEEDVVSASFPTDSESSFKKTIVTRIARVCQNDPGQGKAGEYLSTNGVFTTFRKVRLQCRVKPQRQEPKMDGRSSEADQESQLELTRALAVSEIVPTDDGKDHVFYALMTSSDSVTGLLGICAFSLKTVNEALNRPQLFTWRAVDSDNWLQRLWRTVLPLAGWSTMDDPVNSGSTAYSNSDNTHLQLLGDTPMVQAIRQAAETCSSNPLPEYYARFATLHPLVASSALAYEVLPNGTRYNSGNALGAFTLSEKPERRSNLPTTMTVNWATRGGLDVVHIGTEGGDLLVLTTGLSLTSTTLMATKSPNTIGPYVPFSSEEKSSISQLRFLVQLNASAPISKIVLIKHSPSQQNIQLPHMLLVTSEAISLFTIDRTMCERVATIRHPAHIEYQPPGQNTVSTSVEVARPALHIFASSDQPRTMKENTQTMLIFHITIGLVACCIPIAIVFGFALGRRNWSTQRQTYRAVRLEEMQTSTHPRSVRGYETLRSGTPGWTPVRGCLVESSVATDPHIYTRFHESNALYHYVPTCPRNNCINSIGQQDNRERIIIPTSPLVGYFKPQTSSSFVTLPSASLPTIVPTMSVMHNQLDE